MIRWIQVPREEKAQVTTLEYTVPYICESYTIETQVLFSVNTAPFGTAKTCFSMPKDKKNEMSKINQRENFIL